MLLGKAAVSFLKVVMGYAFLYSQHLIWVSAHLNLPPAKSRALIMPRRLRRSTLGDDDPSRTKQPIIDHVAFFKHLNDRPRFMVAIFNLRQRFMILWIELSPKRRHLANVEPFESRRQQPLCSKNAFDKSGIAIA